MNAPEHSDKKLVAALLRGDAEAFDAFVDDYYPRLYRFAHSRLRDREGAVEDIVQETFRKAVPALGSYRGEAALFTWLCTFCRFEIAAFWRRETRRGPEVELVDDHPIVRAALESLAAVEDGPHEMAVRSEIGRVVRVALDNLPIHYGKVLELKYLEEVPVRDIAERMGMSPKAAESMLTRARRAFRACFAELVEGGAS